MVRFFENFKCRSKEPEFHGTRKNRMTSWRFDLKEEKSFAIIIIKEVVVLDESSQSLGVVSKNKDR